MVAKVSVASLLVFIVLLALNGGRCSTVTIDQLVLKALTGCCHSTACLGRLVVITLATLPCCSFSTASYPHKNATNGKG